MANKTGFLSRLVPIAGRAGSAGPTSGAPESANSPVRPAGQPMMRLAGTDLACVRGGRQVFRGLSFTLGAGEALLVTGPNGAGKSSLLRLVAGLVRPDAGRLEFEGGDPELTIGEHVHYLGHQDALKSSLSVRENLAFWAHFLGGGRPRRSRQGAAAKDATARKRQPLQPSVSMGWPGCPRAISPPGSAAACRLPA